MRIYVFTKKRLTILSLLLASLMFFTRTSHSEEKEDFKKEFSLKITGGWGRIAIGDMNTKLESFNNNSVFEYARLYYPDLISGEIRTLNNRIPDWEFELRMDLSPRFALGISTSVPFHLKNESSIIYTIRGGAGDQTHTFVFRPEIKTWLPIKLGIYYSLPFNSRAGVVFNAGIGSYSVKVSEYKTLEIIFPSGGSYWENRYWKASSNVSFGFHIGIGIEYSLTKNLVVVLESQGTYARVKRLKGIMRYEYDWGGIFEEEGTLYYFSMYDGWIGAGYNDLEVWDEPPELTLKWISNTRKAILDLSGFSLRVGIIIKLF